jgi:hypothetical protein
LNIVDDVAASSAFTSAEKGAQAEMMVWALSAESESPIGVTISELAECFHHVGLVRPNATRMKDYFRLSRNIRSVGGGGYLPVRHFAAAMNAEFRPSVERVEHSLADHLTIPPFVPPERVVDLQRMLRVYSQLFLLENSMRGLVEFVLKAAMGPNWWDIAASLPMKKKHEDRLAKEVSKKWAPTRADFGPLFSVDWSDLITLMRKHETLFTPHIGEIAFLHRYDDAAMFRHVVAHNGALRDEDDFALIGIDYRSWIKQLS